MSERIIIRVQAHFPWVDGWIERSIEVDPKMLDNPFRPLSRKHDVSFDWLAQKGAIQQRKDRAKLSRVVSDVLARAILNEVESRDPKNGYSPEEQETMNLKKGRL